MLPAILKGEIREIERVVRELAIRFHIDPPLIGWVGNPVDQPRRVGSNQHPP
jgi:hypothetical protein